MGAPGAAVERTAGISKPELPTIAGPSTRDNGKLTANSPTHLGQQPIGDRAAVTFLL